MSDSNLGCSFRITPNNKQTSCFSIYYTKLVEWLSKKIVPIVIRPLSMVHYHFISIMLHPDKEHEKKIIEGSHKMIKVLDGKHTVM